MSDGNGSGHGRTRRRGEVLENAIHSAVLAELAQHGYAGLTMEGVAERARTGKSSLYRRWQAKESLVLDTLKHTLPSLDDPAPDTGSLRGDLIYLLTRMSRVLAEPAGQVMYSLIAEKGRQPAIVQAVDDQLIQPRIRLIVDAFQRASERGEVELGDGVWMIARIGPALIIYDLLLNSRPLTQESIGAMVDHVILPSLRGG